ncbi:regulatory protein RecX [Frateuria aurantia]|uniref:Regulatory protein RecX n=1 Tax=Frateuria aurantia (strain ATCC 33424 / DSM 6220 / KCTC 2777 / LMG 1558 / NBRC 3245 / NCIMB 13370) TaxID=767434 RepID=H8KZB6_FRAAD|nr:regulatory protein RecX [Frateuria aurantia]AFC85220.1 hypothetical protein Fraau_0747 [Frateuria aurantia DSM 6220]
MSRFKASARPRPSAYDKALGLLARREHSLFELRRKLGQGGYAADEIRQALERLDASPYQDDQRFGEALLRSRVQQGYGPMRIRVELRSHGLSDRIIAELLEEAAVDWDGLAQRQLIRHYGTEPAEEAVDRQRRAQYLQRRGFSAANIRAAGQRLEEAGTDDGMTFDASCFGE